VKCTDACQAGIEKVKVEQSPQPKRLIAGPIPDVESLEDVLSEPTEATVRAMGALKGDLVVLGVGGKMGPTLARMAKRASDLAGVNRRVIGVSRFSASSPLQERLQSWGIETHRCDLLDRDSYAQLPDAANVVFMAGMKFGATGQESLTWAMNAFVPGLVSERYRRSRIAVFSTGNVYGLSPVSGGGSLEGDSLRPQGEYALSCLGRERIFEHFSHRYQTEMSILRLNYAVELRYGVLLDIAQKVFSEQVIPLEMGHLNAIWQGDAAAMSLQALSHASTPPFVMNIAGLEVLPVRWIAEQFANRFRTYP
jgi:nucleoside-diphosphate-sugar epimerase